MSGGEAAFARALIREGIAELLFKIPSDPAPTKKWCPKHLRTKGLTRKLHNSGIIAPAGSDMRNRLWIRGPSWTRVTKIISQQSEQNLTQ